MKTTHSTPKRKIGSPKENTTAKKALNAKLIRKVNAAAIFPRISMRLSAIVRMTNRSKIAPHITSILTSTLSFEAQRIAVNKQFAPEKTYPAQINSKFRLFFILSLDALIKNSSMQHFL